MKKEGEVCIWRLQPSTKAINDFEDKPLPSFCHHAMHFLPITHYSTYVLLLFCIFNSLYRDMDMFWGFPFAFCLFFLSYQRNALRAQWYFYSLSCFSFYFLWQFAPPYNVAFGHSDWWNTQVWITGFELQAVGGEP